MGYHVPWYLTLLLLGAVRALVCAFPLRCVRVLSCRGLLGGGFLGGLEGFLLFGEFFRALVEHVLEGAGQAGRALDWFFAALVVDGRDDVLAQAVVRGALVFEWLLLEAREGVVPFVECLVGELVVLRKGFVAFHADAEEVGDVVGELDVPVLALDGDELEVLEGAVWRLLGRGPLLVDGDVYVIGAGQALHLCLAEVGLQVGDIEAFFLEDVVEDDLECCGGGSGGGFVLCSHGCPVARRLRCPLDEPV